MGLAEIPYNGIVGHLRGLPSLAFTSADMNLRLPPIKEAPHITNHLSPGLSRLEVIRLLRCRYQEWEKEKRRKVSSGADEFFVLTYVYRCVCNPKQLESHWDQLAATTSRLEHTFRDLGL